MAETRTDGFETRVQTQLVWISARFLALVAGLFGGLALFLATNWLVIKGGPVAADGDHVVGPHLSLLNQYFIGYSVTFVGSLVGFAYAFVTCGLLAYAGARLYNWMADLRQQGPAARQ